MNHWHMKKSSISGNEQNRQRSKEPALSCNFGTLRQPSVKHGGGSVMICCCFLSTDVGDFDKTDFDQTCKTIQKVSECQQLHFLAQQWSQHSDGAVKTNTVEHYQSWTDSSNLNIIEAVLNHRDRERYKRQKQPKKSSECPSSSLENDSWRRFRFAQTQLLLYFHLCLQNIQKMRAAQYLCTVLYTHNKSQLFCTAGLTFKCFKLLI